MKLTELQDMWTTDCKIDQTNLGRSAARVPELHAKYLNLLSTTRMQFRKADTDHLRLRQLKSRYFRGELTKDELVAAGWEQYLNNRPLRNEMDEVLNSDGDIIRAIDKIEYLKTLLYQLEQIIKSINSRGWDIKSCIEWHKMATGG